MKRAASGINCLLAIDKPEGLTSHDVVARVRRLLGERRVGHAGTLDPAATGVLVVGVGQATRLLGQLTLDDKRYDARITFGTETTTDDGEGEVVRTCDVPARLAEPAVASAVVSSLVGTCDQVPPSYSAISIDGKRAYDRARAGEQVEMPTRQVTIHEATLKAVESSEPVVWRCSFHVSKGTYIRSIARDLGRSMGTAAFLSDLRRTASGSIDLSECITLEELAELGQQGVMSRALDPAKALALALCKIGDRELRCVQHGRAFASSMVWCDNVRREPHQGERVALVRGDRLYGVWACTDGMYRSVANFPDGIQGVRA